MTDAPLTASAVISYLVEQEQLAERLYRGLAARFEAQQAVWSRCATACAKNQVQVARSYQETISDALEVGYTFAGLSLDAAPVPTADAPADLAEAVRLAIALEERAARCYEQAADCAEGLLATIPRTLRRAAEIRRRNASLLSSL
ncbi:MAG: hypothetical protein ABFD20_10455 [Anaerolineales bacterium]